MNFKNSFSFRWYKRQNVQDAELKYHSPLKNGTILYFTLKNLIAKNVQNHLKHIIVMVG
jgi:tryptophanyl-tRNA synthetase